MNIKQLHTLLLFVVCAALAACTDDQYNPFSPDPNNGKTPIELSIGGVDAQGVTRAVITDGTDKDMNAFDVNSKIFMIIKSEYVPLGSGYEYLDYGGSTTKKYTVTRGEVASGSNDVTFNTDVQKRYWDDAHARSSKLSIWAYAQKGRPSWNECTFEEPNPGSETDPLNKYKDYPCNTTVLPDPVWRETAIYPAIRYWRASHHAGDDNQDATSVQCQDLLFSNNIADYTSASGSDRRLSFDPESKHFPSKTDVWAETEIKKTEMKFYHAMSKITIHIKKGSGFTTGSFDFTPTNSNITLKEVNKKGLFHIGDGQFEYIWNHKPGSHTEVDLNPYTIPQIYKWNTPKEDDAMTLEALVIPNVHGNVAGLIDAHSRFVPSSTDVMMEFTINNNKYQITSGQLYNALHVGGNPSNALVNNATKKTDNGNYIPLEAGKNYHFTFTIGKSKIENITAKVAEWENVIAEDIPANNAKVKLTLDDRGTAQTENVYFYRSIHTESSIPSDPSAIKKYDWGKGYAKSESAEYSTDHWTTEWFWDDNKSFFHLRALLHTNNNAVNSLTEESNKQYASISSHDSESESTYDAVAWGAPFMQKTGTFTYSTTDGFDGTNSSSHQIYHAIGATEDPIKMLLFHMMSGVHFTIQTTGSDAAHKDKVELCHNNGGEPVTYTRPKVQLVGYLPNGKVWMGTGLVTADGTMTTTSVAGITCRTISTGAYDAQNYYYSAIPQDLTNVQLYITTPDNNQYIVDLKNTKVASDNITSNNLANPYQQGSDGKYTINRWYPGFKYNYTFTLKKSGITDITATIVDWENVTADNEDVQIK